MKTGKPSPFASVDKLTTGPGTGQIPGTHQRQAPSAGVAGAATPYAEPTPAGGETARAGRSLRRDVQRFADDPGAMIVHTPAEERRLSEPTHSLLRDFLRKAFGHNGLIRNIYYLTNDNGFIEDLEALRLREPMNFIDNVINALLDRGALNGDFFDMMVGVRRGFASEINAIRTAVLGELSGRPMQAAAVQHAGPGAMTAHAPAEERRLSEPTHNLLRNFLRKAFGHDVLIRNIYYAIGGDEGFIEDLGALKDSDPMNFTDNAINALLDRGALNGDFFDTIASARPGFASEINAIRIAVLEELS